MLYKVCDAFTRLHKLGMSQVQPADRLQEAVVRHTSALAFLSSHGRHHGALRGRKGASDEEGQRACLLGHHRACYMGEEARGLQDETRKPKTLTHVFATV